MKKSFLISRIALSVVITLCALNFSLAQKLSKEEKKAKKAEEKALKQELKAYTKNLDSYKAFKEEKLRAESRVVELEKEAAQAKDAKLRCENDLKGAKSKIQSAESRLKACETKPKGFGIPNNGLYYVVQIGAFQQSNVPTNNDNPDFRSENNGGLTKYIMGVYDNLAEADQVRDFLMQLDFRSDPAYQPFVVPFRDGQRISIEEALGPEEAERRRQNFGQ